MGKLGVSWGGVRVVVFGGSVGDEGLGRLTNVGEALGVVGEG